MAGIMQKIEDALHMGGGHKEEDKDKHKQPHMHSQDPHQNKHPEEQHYKDNKEMMKGEHKEGFMDKVKDKIHGGEHEGMNKDGEMKKKKEKKKKKEGEHGHDGHSSSSDSD